MRQLTAVIVAACLLISSCSVQRIKTNVDMPRVEITPSFVINQNQINFYKAKPINVADLNCLVKGIYYEARGESTKGKQAVGFVIINRTKYSKYPQTICEVVKDHTVYHGKKVCQFSWYCDHGETRLASDLSKKAGYEECLNVARSILNGTVDNWMPRVVSFHISSLKAGWRAGGMIKVAQIGNHIFYRERNSYLKDS